VTALATKPFHRILLIKPSAVGDIVHTLPVLVKLRARYPDARIDWLVTPENADLVRHHPALTDVVLFDRRRFARFGREWAATTDMLKLLRTLRRAKYDLVIDLHGQLRSAMFVMASGAATRVGFERTREGAWLVYSHHITLLTREVHAVDRYLWLGHVLGFDGGNPDFRIYSPAESGRRVEALLAAEAIGGRRLAVLVPGTVWETKHWRVAGFAEVGRQLQARGFDVVFAGSAKDRPRSLEAASLCPGALDLTGRTTLSEMVELIRRADLCVTNDSGSMHLAVALERPVVSVFGPTSPVLTGPYGRPQSVVRAGVECSPCLLRKLSRCPHDHACMERVTAAMVIERIDQVLPAAA
jgi:heptosyltransferase I